MPQLLFRVFEGALLIIFLLLISSCSDGKKDPPGRFVDPSQHTRLTWKTPGANATVPRFEAQGLGLNGKLYVFGGFFKDGPIHATSQADVYDLATDTWIPLAPVPEELTHAGQATDGEFIYLAGGFVGTHPGPSSNKLWKYHITSDSWSQGPSLPEERGGGALVILNNTLHYFGGAIREKGGETRKDFGDHWRLSLDKTDAAWETVAPLPNPRNHIGGCAVKGKIYAIGGQHLEDQIIGNQSTFQVYDSETDSWSQVVDLPIPKGHITANVVEWRGRILVIAGATQQRTYVASIEEYDPETNTWASLDPLPAPRQSPVSGIVEDHLIVTGGSLQINTWIGQLSPIL